MSTGAWILLAACVVPWLAIELVFIAKFRSRHSAPDQDKHGGQP